MGAAYLTNGTCYMDNDDKLLDLWALYFKQIHANPISVSMFNPKPRISIFSFYSFYLCKYSPQISEIFSNTVPDSSTQCSMYGISTNIKKSPSFVGFYKPYISYMEHIRGRFYYHGFLAPSQFVPDLCIPTTDVWEPLQLWACGRRDSQVGQTTRNQWCFP